jgi:hypothetical protein
MRVGFTIKDMLAGSIRWGAFRHRLARGLRAAGLAFLMAAAILHQLAMAAPVLPAQGRAGPCGPDAVAAAPADTSAHHHRPARRTTDATHPPGIALHGDCGLCTLPALVASPHVPPAWAPRATPLEVPVGRAIAPPSQPPIA